MNRLQAQYLENMGVPVWVSRQRPAVIAEPEPVHDQQGPAGSVAAITRLTLGPGKGARLFVCTSRDQQSGRLAADLARVLPESPVWGWGDASDQGIDLAQAVDQQLFTTVAIFGEDLARSLLGGDLPELVGPARIVVLPSMERLQLSGAARRECWQRMVAGGVAAQQ